MEKYRIVYENSGISVYEGDKWVVGNYSNDNKQIMTLRATVEAMLNHIGAKYDIKY